MAPHRGRGLTRGQMFIALGLVLGFIIWQPLMAAVPFRFGIDIGAVIFDGIDSLALAIHDNPSMAQGIAFLLLLVLAAAAAGGGRRHR